MITETSQGTAGRPAHRDGNVLRWLGAYLASTVGDSAYYMALSWAAVAAGSAAMAGAVLAIGALPRALLLLGGGVLADRWGPRRVVIGSDTARCLVILGTAAALLVTMPDIWLLITVALVFGLVDALFLPAVGALPLRITSRDQLARVQGMRGLAMRVASVTGAPAGGLAVALGGPSGAFALAGVLFAVSVPLLVSVRMVDLPAEATEKDRAPRTPWGELVDGLCYIRGHRVLAPLMLVIALSELGFAGPLNLGLTLLAGERGWGAGGMGWIVGAFGTGAAVASFVLTARGHLPRAGLVMCLSVLGGAAGIVGVAQAPGVPLAAAAALCVGLLAGLGGALCGVLTQTLTESGYLGRVTSVSTLFTLGVAPLGHPVTGAAVSVWGAGPVFAGSAGVCAAGGVLGLCLGPLRRAELPAAAPS